MTTPDESRSPLSLRLAEAGGSPAPHGDATPWASFGDPAGEVRAARDRVALFDLSGRGELELSGADRAKFLHGQSTNDVAGLRPGTGCYAAFLTPKGKMISDGEILADGELLRVGCEPAAAATLLAHLRKFAVFDKVSFGGDAAARSLVHVAGVRAEAAFAELLGAPLPGPAPFSHAAYELPGLAVRVVRVARTGLPGFDLSVPSERAVVLLELLLSRPGLRLAGAEAFRVLRVEAGIPRWGEDMDETTLPDEAGLAPRAISYTKGCYTGQETVARIKAYGHVNRKLVGLRSDAPLAAGSPLFRAPGEEKPAGRVTSSVVSVLLGAPLALGYVPKELVAAGSRLVAVDGSSVDVVALPLPGAGSGH